MTRREAWETILFTVNVEPAMVLVKGQLYECGRGQSLLSLNSWAEKFVWSVQQVRTFFKLLQLDEMIVLEGLQYTTRLTVCNYGRYQDSQHTANTPLTDGQHTANTPLTTIKEREERKERKEEYKRGEKSTRFVPPTQIEIQNYCFEKNSSVNAETFFNFYESKNWFVGKNKMKNWKAAIATWETKNRNQNSNYGNKSNIGGSKSANQNEDLFCGVE